MPLTNIACKNAKPTTKPRKLADSNGLYLEVMPNGSKYWRMKYRFQGKEKRLALGVYPEVSLDAAREARSLARKQLADGLDPSEEKKRSKLQQSLNHENSFEVIAREWHESRAGSWSESHAGKIMRRLEVDVLPKLGNKPIASITAPELLATIRLIESRGALDIARRTLQICGQVFRYAVATGRTERDPSGDLRGALKPVKQKSHAHLAEKELPEYLEKLEAYDGHHLTKFALRLLLLTFVRSGELRGARWDEFDWNKAEWRIPAKRMKMKEIHIVPLAKQTVALLREIQTYTGNHEHLFPNQHNPRGIMSENTLLYALYRMGYHSRATAHGFRSTASTILNEHGFRPDVIERQLAHGERNKIRAAYNHAEYLPERREMMQWWGDYVEGLSQGAEIVTNRFGT